MSMHGISVKWMEYALCLKCRWDLKAIDGLKSKKQGLIRRESKM